MKKHTEVDVRKANGKDDYQIYLPTYLPTYLPLSYIYIYIIFTPNLGLGIAVPDGRAPREHYKAVQRRSRWEPRMTSSVSAWATLVIFYCLDFATEVSLV